MSADKLKAEIMASAEEEKKKIQSQTQERVEQIRAQAQSEIDKIKSKIEDSGRSLAETEANRMLGMARLDEKMRLLAAKEKGVDKVFEAGVAELRSLVQTPTYAEILGKMIVSAGVALAGGDLLVSLRSEDKTKVNPETLAKQISSKTGVSTKLQLTDPPKTSIGGVVVRKGALWVDNTFESIMDRRHESVRQAVAKVLYS